MPEKTLIHHGAWFRFAAVAALALLLPAAAPAASTAELLEEAVFQEETVGDLDAAIEIYQRIADDAETQRPLAARALYRLYRCHERQGYQFQANLVLRRLRQQYPDYEKLLAGEAQDLPRSVAFEPAPWLDDETQVLVVRLPGGAEVGPLIVSVHPAVVEGEEIWRMKALRSYGASEKGSNFVDVRRGSLTPIRGHLQHSAIGRVDVDFLPAKVVFHTLGKEGSRERTVKTGRAVYYFEERFHIFRVLPLEVGYKAVLPMITTFGNVFDLTVEVTSRERVEVPAGTFDCYRLAMPAVGQTFFLSSGPRRELVKAEAQGVYVELVETLRRRPEESFTYHDPDLGFSFTVPAGWHTYRRFTSEPGKLGAVQLLDPAAQLHAGVEAFLLAEDSEPTAHALAEDSIRDSTGRLADLRVREESWQPRQVRGRPATSWISDYTAGGVPMVRHETLVVGTTHGMTLVFMGPAERFEELRGTFDEIAEGLVVP